MKYFEQIKLVTLNDALVETSELANWNSPTITGNTDGTDGQVMVRFPKLWYKEHYNIDGWLTGIEVSSTPKAGLDLHPKFSWGNGRDYIYVGAYEAVQVDTKLCSISGLSTTRSLTMAAFTDLAIARDTSNQNTSQWHIYDYWTAHLIKILFYVYYGNLNSQAVLPGYTDGTWPLHRNTGRSNILTTVNGSIQADFDGVDSDLVGYIDASNETIANRFLFVENIFGHIWKFLHGCAFDGRIDQRRTAFATPDPRLFSSDQATILANYADMDIDLLWIGGTTYVKALGKGLLPVEGAADDATYYCDQMANLTTGDFLRSVIESGRVNSLNIAGVAYYSSNSDFSVTNAGIGTRLCAEQI